MKFRNTFDYCVTGLGLAIAALALPTSAFAATFNFTTGAIGDATATTTVTTYTANVTGLGNATDVNLLLNLTHASLFDLEIYLTAPTGQILNLASALDNTINPVGTVNATLDDAAALRIDQTTDPYTGTFRPSGFTTNPFVTALSPTVSSLAGFNGFNPNGTWTLSIADTSAGSTGTLISSTIDINAAVPFEFSPALGLVALGALYGGDRLRRKLKNK